jgi:hypothetical protein
MLGTRDCSTGLSGRQVVSQDNKIQSPKAKEGGGLLRRVLGLGRQDKPGNSAHSGTTKKSILDLADIQGFIVRGYRMPMVRHFLLTVSVPAAARKILGRLVNGDEADTPQITTAEDWHIGFEPGPGDNPSEPPHHKPDYCLNIGITWLGMIALEVKQRVPNVSFKSFGAFTEGARARAKLVGDTGPSGPENWIDAFQKGDDHMMVTLHAISPEAMKTYTDRLVALFSQDGAFREIWRQDGMALLEMQNCQSSFRV